LNVVVIEVINMLTLVSMWVYWNSYETILHKFLTIKI